MSSRPSCCAWESATTEETRPSCWRFWRTKEACLSRLLRLGCLRTAEQTTTCPATKQTARRLRGGATEHCQNNINRERKQSCITLTTARLLCGLLLLLRLLLAKKTVSRSWSSEETRCRLRWLNLLLTAE